MPRYCSVAWCRASDDPASKHRDIKRKFHKFPNDKARCEKWVQFVSGGSSWTPKNVANYICSDHFSDKVKWRETGRLLKDAVPGKCFYLFINISKL